MPSDQNDAAANADERQSPRIQEGWIGSGLPDVEIGATYGWFPLELLPPIDSSKAADWQWVPRLEEPLEWALDLGKGRGFLKRASAAGLFVPASFRAFVENPALGRAIRSNTACWWSLRPGSFAQVEALGKTLVCFLTDQQSCFYWYLVLDEADPAVLASEYDLLDDEWQDEAEDEDEEEEEDDEEEPAEDEAEVDEAGDEPQIFRVAGSFEEFIYRFWIENEIWFRTGDGEPLTPDMAAYYAETKRLAAQA